MKHLICSGFHKEFTLALDKDVMDFHSHVRKLRHIEIKCRLLFVFHLDRFFLLPIVNELNTLSRNEIQLA